MNKNEKNNIKSEFQSFGFLKIPLGGLLGAEGLDVEISSDIQVGKYRYVYVCTYL
jgi:hypothetical protein